MELGAVEVVSQFWRRMATNEFYSVAEILSPDFVLEWPQSKERIRGADRFARMNSEYPSHGPWQFRVCRVFGSNEEAVSEVVVTDGVQTATAISMFSVSGGKINKIVEYWPEPYPAPLNRAHLVEKILRAFNQQPNPRFERTRSIWLRRAFISFWAQRSQMKRAAQPKR